LAELRIILIAMGPRLYTITARAIFNAERGAPVAEMEIRLEAVGVGWGAPRGTKARYIVFDVAARALAAFSTSTAPGRHPGGDSLHCSRGARVLCPRRRFS
jgi:hypothetical protein